jgi:transcriptional regulator with XRE-family HTH domain
MEVSMKDRTQMAEGGARLRRRRQDLGLSLSTVATALDVTVSAVAQWERGETEPDAAKRPKLARLLKAPTFSALYEAVE